MEFCVGLSIIGAGLVAQGRYYPANLVWSISNPVLAILNYQLGVHSQAVLFAVFTGISWWGAWNTHKMQR